MNCEACGHVNVDGARFCANCGAVMAAPRDSSDPLLGQIIGGRFRIKRVLGEGGMGIVYEAEQQMGSTIRKVAVKTLHKQLSNDPAVAARFHRECGTVAQLEHPNTVKVYDFGSTPDGILYIAMEYLDGKPLASVIEHDGPLDSARVINIVRQIAGSLEEAHDLGIVHRDLKPENVVLVSRAGEKDVVKLLDFGIAARTESADAAKEQKLTQQGMVLGTPPYMSPEQFTGKALDRRSDIYSLGVMTYEMVTATLPFEATTPWQWATEHMTSRPRPFELTVAKDRIPVSMQRAILRSLEKDKENRQPTARAFVEELSRTGTGVVINTGSLNAAAAVQAGAEHTAAMEAVPDFSAAGPRPTADMPAVAGGGMAPGRGATGPAVVAAIPPGQLGPARDSKKGLVIGLAGAGAALLIGIAVVALRSGKSDGNETLALDTSAPSATAVQVQPVEAPEATEPDPEVEATDPVAAPTSDKPATRPTPKPGPSSQGGARGTSETPAGKAGAAATAAPTTVPTTPPPAEPVSGNKACALCVESARAANIPSAAKYYAQCENPALKSRCSSAARSSAASAAKAASNNGDCGKVKSIAAAANAMGAGSPTIDAAAKKCR